LAIAKEGTMQISEQHIATALMALPFLALCAGGLVAQYFAIRSELSRIRSARVVARREGGQ
jgi:hypothetical protein